MSWLWLALFVIGIFGFALACGVAVLNLRKAKHWDGE